MFKQLFTAAVIAFLLAGSNAYASSTDTANDSSQAGQASAPMAWMGMGHPPATGTQQLNLARPEGYGVFMNPMNYGQFMNPATYAQFMSPAFYMQFADPNNLMAWMNPNAYAAYMNPMMYSQMMNPMAYMQFANPAMYMQMMNPASYQAYMNPNTYMQWMNPAVYSNAGAYGGNSAGFNWFDPNAWGRAMPQQQQPQASTQE